MSQERLQVDLPVFKVFADGLIYRDVSETNSRQIRDKFDKATTLLRVFFDKTIHFFECSSTKLRQNAIFFDTCSTNLWQMPKHTRTIPEGKSNLIFIYPESIWIQLPCSI
ncbi:hypothetical protein Pedsa_0448 [Pseudopedobacter saltans DSM 12145]|uniref:Uncharacterized protein n=1 Tax=Pseudopedobacter saltans (strain ATCC 51119 / DSM 12145 / JCM 21818 / CCUG 39354 / LMG 10337 / NBRC 100064 / NCIMB 13643) TaxID=762903 RepID=F0S5V9_PSESL|nr:hypothetical protein Pedsa_0448 [Pseudopedobacter saltans DSM 12145]